MIFKVLIGTMVILLTASLIIEIYNLNLVGAQLKRIMNIAMTKSCDYFAEETYKGDNDTRAKKGNVIGDVLSGSLSGNKQDIKGNTGVTVVSGKFYESDDPNQIYSDLYRSADFKQFCSTENLNNWKTLALLSSSLNGTTAGLDSNSERRKDELKEGQYYTESLMTALNVGIPYLDKATVEKIMRWNTVMLLCNGRTENIVCNDPNDSSYYVQYNGFRVYFEDLHINDIKYEVMDVLDTSHGGGRDKWLEYTNIDAANLGISGTDDERRHMCVASLTYNVKVRYQGVTPWRYIMQYMLNRRVNGYHKDDTTDNTAENLGNYDAFADGSIDVQGGDGVSNGTYVDDSILYYIVR